MNTKALALAAVTALASGCASYADQAREECAAYGLADDPQCIMLVAEHNKALTTQAVGAWQMSNAITSRRY